MHRLFLELKQKHVYRVAAAYAVVAWVLLQLFNNVAPILELPPSVGRIVLLLLVIGFPLTIGAAWMRQIGPADASAKLGTLDWALVGALVVVIGLASYEQLAGSRAGTGVPASS